MTNTNKNSMKDYWSSREDYSYYRVAKNWIEEFSPGDLIIDVGSRGTPVVTYGKFYRRISIDLELQEPQPGVETVMGNWMNLNPPVADVLLCMQVLEHLDDDLVIPFAKKLLQYGKHIIISVPYMWPKGLCKYHKQDPVDLAKLESWVGASCVQASIVSERKQKYGRLVALFDGIGI